MCDIDANREALLYIAEEATRYVRQLQAIGSFRPSGQERAHIGAARQMERMYVSIYGWKRLDNCNVERIVRIAEKLLLCLLFSLYFICVTDYRTYTKVDTVQYQRYWCIACV